MCYTQYITPRTIVINTVVLNNIKVICVKDPVFINLITGQTKYSTHNAGEIGGL